MGIGMSDTHSSCLIGESSIPILISEWNKNVSIYLKLNLHPLLWIQIFISILILGIWSFWFLIQSILIPVMNQAPPNIIFLGWRNGKQPISAIISRAQREIKYHTNMVYRNFYNRKGSKVTWWIRCSSPADHQHNKEGWNWLKKVTERHEVHHVCSQMEGENTWNESITKKT